MTHEDVTVEGSAAPTCIRRKRHLRLRGELDGRHHPLHQGLLVLRAAEQLRGAAGLCPAPTRPTAGRASLRSIIPDNPNAAYDMKDIIIETVDNGDFFEVKEQFAPNLIVGFAATTASASASSPTSRLTSRACSTSTRRSRRVSCASATASTSRSSPSSTCRASAGHGAGIRRRHPQRRQDPLRLRRGDRPEGHRDHPQGLRRRVLRHVLEAPARRHQLRLAERRDRR